MFARPDGRPLDPRRDYEEFKELLAEAGIDPAPQGPEQARTEWMLEP
ncbi:hypothetical protein [Streptomyces sp. WZ.A104]|nr:hypothetical protein [Streptomyces sp. WZ.A104]